MKIPKNKNYRQTNKKNPSQNKTKKRNPKPLKSRGKKATKGLKISRAVLEGTAVKREKFLHF